jgi:hypothetical protein
MWALIEDGSITKHLSGNRGITIGDIQYSRNIFSFRWSNEEREAIGLYEIVWDNSKKKDEEYYTNTNQTFTYDADAGTVTATYGDATAKAHADANATDEDGEELDPVVVIEGLKTIKIRNIKVQAASELARTDWYIVRKADANTAVPSAITNHRAAVRTKCASMETAITNASNTAAIETLYTRNAEGVRPLGDLPTLEV